MTRVGEWVGRVIHDAVVQPERLRQIYEENRSGDLLDLMVAYKRDAYHHLGFLYGFVRRLAELMPPPLMLVETGVQEGNSAAIMLLGLADSGVPGRLWSVDKADAVYKVGSLGIVADDRKGPTIGTGEMVPERLRGRWSLAIGDAKDVLADVLDDAGPLALFHHDSLHTPEHMAFEFGAAWPRLRPGGVLAADDALWTRALDDLAARENVHAHYAQNTRHLGAGGFVVKGETTRAVLARLGDEARIASEGLGVSRYWGGTPAEPAARPGAR